MPTESPSLPAPAEPNADHDFGFILFITAITAIGGFLFGYDTAVISGAVYFLQHHFCLNDNETGWAGASAIVGCIPGAMIAGFLSDRFGRQRVLLLCAILYALSGVASALPQTFTQFILARFVGGVGIGVSSMVCPVYIAEIAPEKHRGRLGSLFQLGIVIGIFLVFFVNLLIQRMGDDAWNATMGWRIMLGSEALPAIVFFFLLLIVPESPRWMLLNGRERDAKQLMTRIMGLDAAQREITAVMQMASLEEGRLSELFSKHFFRPLLIAVLLAIFAQFSGINAIMYYAPRVFKSTSDSTNAAFAAAVWVGAINVVLTFVAILFVDRAGRKPLLLIGTAIQSASLLAVGWMYHSQQKGFPVLLCILVYVGAFSMAMGPIPWIIISEIFPARIRGRASSAGVFMVWVSCFIVAQTFPTLDTQLGPAITFWIYAGCSIASFLFVLLMVPETKGKTLEEIEASWRHDATSATALK